MAEGFTNRVATNVSPAHVPDARSFRSGVAEGLQQLGQTGQKIAEQDAAVERDVLQSERRIEEAAYRRELSRTVADRAGAWADTVVSLDDRLEQLKKEAKPGAPGYGAAADKAIDDTVAAYLATLPDNEEVRNRLKPMAEEQAARMRVREHDWGRVTAAKFEGASLDKWSEVGAVGLQRNPTSAGLMGYLADVDRIVGGSDLDGSGKALKADDLKSRGVRAYLDGLLEQGNWQGVRKLLTEQKDGKGPLDQWVDPETRRTYLARVDNAESIAANAEARAVKEAQAQVQDQIKALKARQDAGEVIPAPELRAIGSAAKAAGLDESDLVDVDILTTQNEVNRVYAPLVGQPGGADRLRRERDALALKIAQGTATRTEQRTKAQLDKLVDKGDSEETKGLKALIEKGPQGQLAVLDAIRGGSTPEARYERAEKVQEGLGFLANLRPEVQQRALNGRVIRDQHKGSNGQPDKTFGTRRQVEEVVNRMLGPLAQTTFSGSYRDIVDRAWDMMAERVAGRGTTGVDATQLEAAVLELTGAHRDASRGGRLVGGVQPVRGKPVVVPEWMSGSELDSALARHDYSRWRYPSGKAIDKADLLANYRPELIGVADGARHFYQFVDAAGGVLVDPDTGAPYQLVVRP